MSFKCVGCDTNIGWDGEGVFCYTCPCGAHIFYDNENGSLAPPASLVFALKLGRPLPHLDYLVGESDHTSAIKERLISELREKGAIWMSECEQCQKDGTLQRKLEREKALAVFEAEMIIKRSGAER